jgi:DNA processing protein
MNHSTLLAYFPKLTYARYQKLRAYFVSSNRIWEAEFEELVRAGLDSAIADEFIAWRERIEPTKIFEELEREGITTISLGEAAYPKLLGEIADPPHTLFVRGSLQPLEVRPAVAIVGTRRATQYGILAAEKITGELAAAGVVIVSGLALGIDGTTHRAAIAAKTPTIAVLGSGVNTRTITPVTHQKLAEEIIASGGAVISEYPPGFAPTHYSFPARNRIIAGLSRGTLVVEAPEESGALITARAALDYNREVFAVPQPITNINGRGCNKLIQQGAQLVTNGHEILDTLNIQDLTSLPLQKPRPLPESPTEARILECLSNEPQHIDIIIQKSGLESRTVNGTLVVMEMKGQIKNVGGMTYILV